MNNPPDPAIVLDLIEAFRRSKTMFAAVSLGIFEMLAAGPATAMEIAARLASDPEATERLLEACAGLGLLRREGAAFANTDVSTVYLVPESELCLNGYIQSSNDVTLPMWSHLEDAVREGSNRWRQTFGFAGPLFDSFFPTAAKMRTFIMGMHGFGVLSSPAVVRAFDLGGFRRIVDLGGATGHLTIAACECYPNLRGVVFDFEKVLAIAREQIAKSPARDRIECAPGDFFQGDLPQADLYAMGRILHDWPPDKVEVLARKVYEQLPPGGALLLAEKLLDDDKLGPVPAQMQSLNMLVCTEGKERSLAEYRALLTAAGFSDVQGARTGKAVDAVLARKAQG
jgi:acetylserotonin N-methyltransferase